MRAREFITENMDHSQDDRAVEELRAALLAKQDQLQSATDDQVYDIIDKIMTRIARSHSISGQKLHDMWVDKYRQIPDTWIMNEGLEQEYLSQIPNLTWKPVSRSVWNTIQDEGLDEEQDAPSHTDWAMASLSIDPKDAQALQAFDSDAIEDFNRFDIHLKSCYPGLTDLIDYDRGTITIVKPIQMQGVAENFADGKGPGRPGDSVRHGIPKKATMAELEKASHAKGRKGQLARWQLNMRRGKKK